MTSKIDGKKIGIKSQVRTDAKADTKSHITSSCLFKAKTSDAHSIKILIELLQNNLQTGSFKLSSSGISLSMPNSNNSMGVVLELDASKFNIYEFRFKKERYIGVNLNHFHDVIRNTKKNDSILFTITADNENMLWAKIYPKDTGCRTRDFNILLSVPQTYELDLPDDYEHSIIANSTDFQKGCKEIAKIDNNIIISSKTYSFRMHGKKVTHGIGSTFGEEEDDDEEDEEYEQTFVSNNLLKICKISGLHKSMQVYIKRDNPLLIKSLIGSIGEISIYIKSNECMTNESDSIELNVKGLKL